MIGSAFVSGKGIGKIVALVTLCSMPPHSKADDSQLTLYSTRDRELVEPLLEAFTRKTGIKVDLVIIESHLPERLKQEDAASPADVLMTIDFNNLIALQKHGLTRKIESSAIVAQVPVVARDPGNQWIGLSLRPRVIITKLGLSLSAMTYEELADPKWRGKFCMRPISHKNNIALASAFLLHHDEASTKSWLKDLKANLAHRPEGKDYDVIRDIAEGNCEIGIANTNAVAQLRAGRLGEEGKAWASAVQVLDSRFVSGATHFNVTGAAIARHAPHPNVAQQFIEFLVTPNIQAIYAEADSEFPLSDNVRKSPAVAAFGSFKPDTLLLTEIDAKRSAVEAIVKDLKFDE